MFKQFNKYSKNICINSNIFNKSKYFVKMKQIESNKLFVSINKADIFYI